MGGLRDRGGRQETDSRSHAARQTGMLESDSAVANIVSHQTKPSCQGKPGATAHLDREAGKLCMDYLALVQEFLRAHSGGAQRGKLTSHLGFNLERIAFLADRKAI